MKKHRLHRFQKLITQIIILVTGYWLLVTSCWAQPISSAELIENAKYYDGKVVTYRGEVIGDIMVRGDYAWVNLKDEVQAIGIWCSKEDVKFIRYKGSYKYRGDIIQVRGLFHRSCPQHGGDLDIHAIKMIKLTEGYRIEPPLEPKKLKTALTLSIIAVGLIILYVFRRHS